MQLPGYESLDETLSNVPEGRRGDYLFRNQGIIIEQKDFCVDRRDKIENIYRRSTELLRQYDPENTWLRAFLEHGHSRQEKEVADQIRASWPEKDRRAFSNMVFSAVRFLEKDLLSANDQISNSKKLLNIQQTYGLALFTNQQSGHFHPAHLASCIQRLLAQTTSNNQPRFCHVNGVLLFQKLQGFTIEGKGGITLYIPGNSEGRAVDEFAKEIARVLAPGSELRPNLYLLPDHMRRSNIQVVNVRFHLCDTNETSLADGSFGQLGAGILHTAEPR